ncbi:unnamed protein product [Calypogeia fissa]
MRVLEVKGNTEEKNSGRWKGYITASIAVPLDRTWQIGSDFSGLHKFVPIVEVCERLKGCNRTPGCIRFYTMNSATGLPGGKRKAWARDKLLNIEEKTHSYTYAVEGTNMNLENCQITFKASDGKDGSTVVTWAWEVDPVKKSTKEKTLSDMAEFGCTFIKGLEAAVATTDSIDYNFEGAPLAIDTLSDAPAAAGCGFGGPYYDSLNAPALSLMKSRLDTLTQSLNKICQKLENSPIPADLYQSELDILQSTLADGRRSLVNHLHAYMLVTPKVDQSTKSFRTRDIIDNETCEKLEDCPLMSEKNVSSQNDDSVPTCKSDKGFEDCSLLSSENVITSPPKENTLPSKSVDALLCPDNSKARSACPKEFPKLALEEDLKVEMDNVSRSAYEAFQEFSNQFQSDLRDDISHQLESMGTRLAALGFDNQEGTSIIIQPSAENQGANNALSAGPMEDADRAQITMQTRSNDITFLPSSPSSDGRGPSSPSRDVNVAPPPGCQTLEDDRGQFGVWQLDALRSQRLQDLTKDLHSLRIRSRFLFQDLLQLDKSQASDHNSHEIKDVLPPTLQLAHSIEEIRRSNGSSPHCQTALLGDQKSPPSYCPKRASYVPIEYPFQPEKLGLRRFSSSPPVEDDNRQSQGAFQSEVHRYLIELETGGPDQGVQTDYQISERYKRPTGPEVHEASLLTKMAEDSSPLDFESFKEFGEGYQQLKVDSQSWQRRGSKMQGTSQNLQADLSSPQINETKMLLSSSPESQGDEFLRQNALSRPSRLPPDIWPEFPLGESGGEKRLVKRGPVEDIVSNKGVEDISEKGHGEGNIRRKSCGHADWDMFELRQEQFYPIPANQDNQEKRDIMQQLTSSSPPQTLENYAKNLQFKSKSLPPRLSLSVEPVHRVMTRSSMSSLEKKSPFKVASLQEATSSPVFESTSWSKNRSSDRCPPYAAHPMGRSAENVTLDLRNEIAPGVFHCRQGNQTRVVVNVPDNVETREQMRRQMRSLQRKDEIYKEFQLLGIQKPPTEQEILKDFAAARFQKQQDLQALSETEVSVKNDSLVFQPYFSEGKVWNPGVRNSPAVDKSRFEKPNNANGLYPTSLNRFSVGHSVDALKSKPPTGQKGGQSSKPKNLSCKTETSRKQSPNGRNFDRMSQSEHQGNVTSSFQNDETSMTSESLRGDPTAQEMAVGDSNRFQTSWEAFKARQDFHRVPSCEGSTYRRSYPPVQKRELLIMGNGERAHVQPSTSSKAKKKPPTGDSSLTESSSRSKTTSSGENASPESKSMGSGDSFAPLERVDEMSSSDYFSTNSPKIRVHSQAEPLNGTDTPTITSSTLESRQSAVSPHSSSHYSMAKIPSNLSQDSKKFFDNTEFETTLLLLVERNAPSSRQPSLNEGVGEMPLESGSSEVYPYKPSVSPQIRAYSEAQMLKTDTPAMTTNSNLESQQPVLSPQSMAAIFSNFPPDFEDYFPLETTGLQRPSPQLSLDEVMKNAPSESGGSSEFDPFRTPRIWGSIKGSSSSGHSFPGQQLFDHVPHFTPRGKPTSAAQSNALNLDSLMYSDNLSEGQQGSSNAIMESQPHGNCPFRQLKDKLDEVFQSSESTSPPTTHLDGRPHEINVRVSWADQRLLYPGSSSSIGEGSGGTPSSSRNLAFSAIVDGIPQAYDGSQHSSEYNVTLEEPRRFFEHVQQGLAQNPFPISHEAFRQLDAERVQKSYRDAQTQTHWPKEEPEVTQKGSFLQTSQIQKLSDGDDGLKTRQSIQKLDSMANVAQFMDAQNSYSQMLDNVVGQTVESISSYKARKKREADELAFRTRQSAQMLNSMLNVRDFTDDNRSYSTWLDGVAPLSVIQTPMKDSEVQTPMNSDSDIQTPWNESDSGVGPREPRFREDSAANFLGSVSMQILQEFSDSKKPEADTQDQLDPLLQEDSMALLGALSKQIIKEYTDYTNDQSQTEGQSEGPQEQRFREQSALNFLTALSEQVLPEFRDRRGSQVMSREPRFRETSAINFMNALKEQIMQRNGQSSTLALPSSGDQTEFENSQNPTNVDDNWNLQPRTSGLKNQASSSEGLNYQPDSDGQVSPDEGLSYELASSEGQEYPEEALSTQPESEGQGTLGENLSSPEPEGSPYPGDGLSYLPESEGTPGESSSYQPASSEDQAYPDDGPSYQPESEGQSFLGDGFSDQPDPAGQTYQDEVSSFQPESEGQGTRGKKLSLQPFPGGEGALGERLSYPRKSEGQGTRGGRLSYQRKSEGQGYPGKKSSYQSDAEDQGFRRSVSFQRKSAGHSSTQRESSSYQRASKGQSYSDEGPSYQPESEDPSSPGDQLGDDQDFWDKGGFGFEPESGGQGTPSEDLRHQPDPEGEASPDMNDQPEGEAQPDEGDKPEEGEGADESLNDQVSPDGEGFDAQTADPEGEGGDADGGWSDEQPDGEGAADLDESLNGQPEEQASETESGEVAEESQNQSQFGRNSQFQLGSRGSQSMSQRNSQVSQLNEMLQDLHTTVSRSRQNSVSNPGK